MSSPPQFDRPRLDHLSPAAQRIRGNASVPPRPRCSGKSWSASWSASSIPRWSTAPPRTGRRSRSRPDRPARGPVLGDADRARRGRGRVRHRLSAIGRASLAASGCHRGRRPPGRDARGPVRRVERRTGADRGALRDHGPSARGRDRSGVRRHGRDHPRRLRPRPGTSATVACAIELSDVFVPEATYVGELNVVTGAETVLEIPLRVRVTGGSRTDDRDRGPDRDHRHARPVPRRRRPRPVLAEPRRGRRVDHPAEPRGHARRRDPRPRHQPARLRQRRAAARRRRHVRRRRSSASRRATPR